MLATTGWALYMFNYRTCYQLDQMRLPFKKYCPLHYIFMQLFCCVAARLSSH
uniref:Uncharacterized protein n=1 Tax=Anguilla anguilla TaxID=7936 RepID=A0A0E9WQU6_ANGAN